MSTWTDDYGQVLTHVHSSDACLKEHCTLHNPSDHHMKTWPQLYRFDRALMERTCPHGIGHPDPDEIYLDRNARGVHGCDGCC